jgi:hypothetical protein
MGIHGDWQCNAVWKGAIRGEVIIQAATTFPSTIQPESGIITNSQNAGLTLVNDMIGAFCEAASLPL